MEDKVLLGENKLRRVDLIKALIGIDEDISMADSVYNIDGSVVLYGYRYGTTQRQFTKLKYLVEDTAMNLLINAKTFNELYAVYRDKIKGKCEVKVV